MKIHFNTTIYFISNAVTFRRDLVYYTILFFSRGRGANDPLYLASSWTALFQKKRSCLIFTHNQNIIGHGPLPPIKNYNLLYLRVFYNIASIAPPLHYQFLLQSMVLLAINTNMIHSILVDSSSEKNTRLDAFANYSILPLSDTVVDYLGNERCGFPTNSTSKRGCLFTLPNSPSLSFNQCRLFSSSTFLSSPSHYKHPWEMVDRLDPFMDTISPEGLKSFDFTNTPLSKIKSKIYGLHSYLFSSKMSLEIDPNDLDTKNDMIMAAAVEFLKSLKDNTVYKCLFVGITHEGDIKSSAEGAFYLSVYTRPLYIVMKVNSGVQHFANRYKGIRFDSYSLAYKQWLLTKDITDKKADIGKALDRLNASENADHSSLVMDSRTPRLNANYHRWIQIVGPIGGYKIVDSSKYIVNMTYDKVLGWMVDIESATSTPELVSWVDQWVDEYQLLWVRTFKAGVKLFYKGSEYLHYEILFKTQVWMEGFKDYEYNSKFGCLDIETYKTIGDDGDGLQVPYASGFTDFKGVSTLFYIQPGESEFGVLVRMLDALLCRKYSGGTFYAHNMARFDSRLIMEAIGMMGGLRCTLWGRDMNNLFKIRISKKVGQKRYNIVLLDSLYQLPFKLSVLGKKFNTDVQKSCFPYNFVKKDTLFYKGEMPHISYYSGDVSDADYKELFKNPWDLKEESLRYLKNDLECLHQVMHKYNKTVFQDFLVNAVKVSSYSALSKMVYITNYYPKVGCRIPVIGGYLESWIRNAYKGGVVDVLQHLVSNAVKYDSNSHYPAAMLNDMPVGTPRFTDIKDLSKIFGFCYVEVRAPNKDVLRCTILPTKNDQGELHCPRGVWRDTYFSEELKNAVKYGYQVRVISAVIFDRGAGIFDEFIHEMFKRKAAAKEVGDPVGELLYKLMQNSLYGKSGQKEIIHRFKLLDNLDVERFERQNKTDLSHVFGGKTLIRTQGKINAELEGVITTLLEGDDRFENNHTKEVDEIEDLPLPSRKIGSVKSSVSTAAAITAYARIAMSQYKNIEGNKYLGGDTDSAIMEKELKDELIGSGLGMMKEESRINVGLFADKKLYLTVDNRGVTLVRSRGVGRSLETGEEILKFADFIKLFKGEALKILKTKFIIESDGIYIKPQNITVKISDASLVEIKQEVEAILADINHPLYGLALTIGAFTRD